MAWRKAPDLNLHAGGGSIVNLASIAGKEGNRNQAAHSASKAGVIGLTKSIGKDQVKRKVLVNCITPKDSRAQRPHHFERGSTISWPVMEGL